MIKFFRKIRLDALSRKRFPKYFTYALGEIILVVIGILIALQINNWNENRQKRNLEGDYLTEIKENLVRDTININSVMQFQLQKIDSIKETLALFKQAKNSSPYFASLEQKLPVLASQYDFEPVRTAFDNMVSSEKISLISNKKLRAELSSYYSDYSYKKVSQERLLELTRKFVDDIAPKIMFKENINSIVGVELNMTSSSEINIHKDEEVISNLFLMNLLCSSVHAELTNKKEVIVTLIAQIETEKITQND